MVKMKFKRETINDETFWVWRAANGSTVRKYKRNYDMGVCDSKGRWLGLTGSDEEAVAAAESERVLQVSFNGVSDLCLWEMWNDAVTNDKDAVILQEVDGLTQVMVLGHSLYMTAKPDGDGWDVQLATIDEIHELFSDGDGLLLRHCDKPYKLQ